MDRSTNTRPTQKSHPSHQALAASKGVPRSPLLDATLMKPRQRVKSMLEVTKLSLFVKKNKFGGGGVITFDGFYSNYKENINLINLQIA